jgi:steroid delta-isomerase-like uncharacterized protein
MRKGDDQMSLEQNRTMARRSLEEVWNQGTLDIVDEIFATDYVYHDPGNPEGWHGQEGIRQAVSTYRAAFPDLHFTIEDMVAEGDRVVLRWTGTGTHKGELMGIPPTGKQVTIPGINLVRYEGSKAAEEWSGWDTLGMMQQLGVIPPMGGGE